ncbi:MAG: hypothetical protein LBE48_04315 [Methanomassiliicoccaceae archaeon]|jgi:alpha-tubulin suppressor-like RCC1 family protein|nr:hypothetical protein [Methanomassiliicoccaceae archaeon]
MVTKKTISEERKKRSFKAVISVLMMTVLVFASAQIFFSQSDDNENDNVIGAGSGMPMIAAGEFHSLVLKDDGTVWSWGQNDYGQLGNGKSGLCINKSTPVQVLGPDGEEYLTGVIAIAAGWGHSLALKDDGTVWSWGYNKFGQLGDGTFVSGSTPAQVSGLANVTAITAGNNHSLALKDDGTVWTWGYNGNGQLGNGTIGNGTDKVTPVQVLSPSGTGFLTNIIKIAAHGSNSFALKDNGTAWAWGFNSSGQLGDYSYAHKSRPVQVMNAPGTPLTNVKDIAVGLNYSVFLKNDGTVWGRGYNGNGQLGNGETVSRITLVQASITNVTAIAAGDDHTIALKSDGTVWAWGYNIHGELGDGTVVNKKTPVKVSALSGVKAIDAGSYHSLALKDDGTVWAWGLNHYGQLGDGTEGKGADKKAPVQVKDLNVIVPIDVKILSDQIPDVQKAQANPIISEIVVITVTVVKTVVTAVKGLLSILTR